MGWTILAYVLSAIITVMLFNLSKIFFLDKLNINKWILLGISIVILILPAFLGSGVVKGIWQYVNAVIFMYFFLWFIDKWGVFSPQSKKEEKKVVIKPKAKPNRVKGNKGGYPNNNNNKKKKK